MVKRKRAKSLLGKIQAQNAQWAQMMKTRI
jgi:hypothetical protein